MCHLIHIISSSEDHLCLAHQNMLQKVDSEKSHSQIKRPAYGRDLCSCNTVASPVLLYIITVPCWWATCINQHWYVHQFFPWGILEKCNIYLTLGFQLLTLQENNQQWRERGWEREGKEQEFQYYVFFRASVHLNRSLSSATFLQGINLQTNVP